MILGCEQCGKEGSLDEGSYLGKRLLLRCPYCSHEFIYSVSPVSGSNGNGAAVSETPPAPVDEATENAILEAKRIARLIISEIKLYNHEKIARAETKKEVLDLLKTDLMRGKQHYSSRVADKLPAGPDYFMESVKEILLAGKN